MPDKPVLRFCGKVPRRLGLSGCGGAFLLVPRGRITRLLGRWQLLDGEVERRLFSPLVRGAKVLRPLHVVRKDGLSGNEIRRVKEDPEPDKPVLRRGCDPRWRYGKG